MIASTINFVFFSLVGAVIYNFIKLVLFSVSKLIQLKEINENR